MTQRLTGRTALVTGSTSGIGHGIAVALAGEGARVAVHGRDAARGAAAVDAIRAAGGDAVFVAADLGASAAAVRAFAKEAITALGGRVDVLVNNAGIFPSGATVDIADDSVDAILAVNVRAPHVLTAALAPAMLERGSGTIINVGSWVSTVGLGNGALYSASKAALEQLTRGWAAEFGRDGVRVNTIAPGVTLTEGTAGYEAMLEPLVKALPGGRFATPDDIARGVVYLASDDASYVHGATLVVDGGALATRT
jgi:NAD(P)-dependent dehydrogenase (short-subunit alcohol dehydrogenase family)